MYNKISLSAIAAMAALSMVSLTACSDEDTNIVGATEESGLSSSSTPSVEPESSSGGVVNLCEPLTEGAITRFWVKDEGDRLKDACSEPLTVIGDGVYAEDCNEENYGRVLSLWSGNPKYGYMTYYKCQKDSWVKGDISLTCDTAGVAVGDTCVKQYSINIFQAGMNPTGMVVSFVYKGEGVWAKVEAENADGDSVQVELKCDYETKGAKTRFLVKQSGEVLKDVCSEPSPDIDDDVYAEDCNAENEGRVLPLWRGNAKYGGMSYYKCQKDSWVEGDIRLTCDTAGVAVGDTCRKTGMMGIFRASMPHDPSSEYVFIYAGDGVWNRADQSQIDSQKAKQERYDAALKEQCDEPELGKSNRCCFTPPAEVTEEYPGNGSVLYEYERDSHEWLPRAYFSSSDCDGQVKEIIED